MAALLIPLPTLHDPGCFLYSRPQGAVKIAAHVCWICHTYSKRRGFCAPFLFLRFHIDFGPMVSYYLVISLMVFRSFVCFKIVSSIFSCFLWDSLLNTSLHRSSLLELKFHLGERVNVLKMSTVPRMEVLKKEMGREREASGLRGRGESGTEGEGKRNRRKGKK